MDKWQRVKLQCLAGHPPKMSRNLTTSCVGISSRPFASSTRAYISDPGAEVWGSLRLAVMYCNSKHVARSHARSEAQKRDPHDTRESTTRRCSRTSHGGSDQEFHFQPSEREKISVDFPETTNPPVAKKVCFYCFFPPLALRLSDTTCMVTHALKRSGDDVSTSLSLSSIN